MIDYVVSMVLSKYQSVGHREKTECHLTMSENIQAKGSCLVPWHVRVTSASGGTAKYELILAVVVDFRVW